MPAALALVHEYQKARVSPREAARYRTRTETGMPRRVIRLMTEQPIFGKTDTGELVEIAIEYPCSGLQEHMRPPLGPSHRLPLVEPLVHDLVERPS